MDLSDLLGYVAGALTTIALLPQVWRTFRTRDVSGISLKMYLIFTTGVAVWLAYGIVLGETPMILANSVSLVLAFAVLAMKLRFGGKGKGKGKSGKAAAGKDRMARA
jgi:MtN3 and saliva related transmembrane protein